MIYVECLGVSGNTSQRSYTWEDTLQLNKKWLQILKKKDIIIRVTTNHKIMVRKKDWAFCKPTVVHECKCAFGEDLEIGKDNE